jgi:solute carrier family 25 protein 39/40
LNYTFDYRSVGFSSKLGFYLKMNDDCCMLCCKTPKASDAGLNAEKLDSDILPKTDEFTKQVVASSIASVVNTLLLNPLNVLKVRLQSSRNLHNHVSLSTITSTLIRNEGVRGLWSGTSIALAMSVPNTIFYMTVYEKCKVVFRDCFHHQNGNGVDLPTNNMGIDPWWIPGAAGGTARVFAVTAISPLEMVRTIKASGNHLSSSSILKDIFQKEGIRGIYKGWGATLWRDCPFSAIYWCNVELWKPVYYNLLSSLLNTATTTESPNKQILSMSSFQSSSLSSSLSGESFKISASIFLAGSTGSFLSALITHPFDVIKTQRQLAEKSVESLTSTTTAPSSNGSWSLVRQVVVQEGFYGLYRGLSMRLLTVIPGSAVLLTVYEAIKALNF